MKKVILIGYMGSGKSVIAKKLSQNINFEFIELDQLIENTTQKSVSEIFSSKGELFFRKLERQLLKEVLSSEKKLIVSTGGGTPCYFDNYKLFNSSNCVSIYLKASLTTLCNRLESDRVNRPLLAEIPSDELREFIAKHVFERSYFYEQAQRTIMVDGKSVNQIAFEIEQLLF